MKHVATEIKLANGARGLLIDVPGATVMSFQFQFRAGNRYVKNKDIYEQIIDNFILTDGNNEYFAYTAGNYYTKDYDLEYSEETESLEDSTLNDLKNKKLILHF